MLHELLLALHGIPGDVFVESFAATEPPSQQQPKQQSTTFRVAADFPFLHAAERSALDRLAHLGFLAATIRRFAQKHAKTVWAAALNQGGEEEEDGGSADDDNGKQSQRSRASRQRRRRRRRPGIYLLALCTGLDEILDDYDALIVQAETKILSSLDLDTDAGRTPVSYFTYLFGKYHILFPQLVDLLQTIEANPDDTHGTKLLNILHDRCRTGLSEARSVFLRLFQICMAVAYKQIIGWMLYGQLDDQYEEFFILVQPKEDPADVRGKEMQLQAEDTRWQSQIKLKTAALPHFIPLSLAQTVLFVGKAVLTIKDSQRPETTRAAALISRHQATLSNLAESPEFRALAFEMAVTALKKDVATILWDVVVMDEHLDNHLKAFKECYMLGAGDLWMAFIEECGTLKTRAASRLSLVTDYELNATFRLLMRQLGMPNAAFNAEHFRFKIVSRVDEEPTSQQLIGGEFRLEYVVKWPMDLVFTQSDIDKYNQVLIFLLALKATHMRVQRVCSSISQSMRVARGASRSRRTPAQRNREEPLPIAAALPREMWQLRAMMMFFLDCLWSYIQMDVLEASHQKLLTQIMLDPRTTSHKLRAGNDSDDDVNGGDDEDNQSTAESSHHVPSSASAQPPPPLPQPQRQQQRARPDFEQIQAAHHAHVDRILRGCFLDPATLRLVGGTIRQAVAACDAFCGIVDRLLAAGSWGSMEMEQDVSALAGQIKGIREDFEGQTSFLFRTFSGVQNSADGGAHARALGQLLLRMDFNRFFSVGVSEPNERRQPSSPPPPQPAFYAAAARGARRTGDGGGGGHDALR
ncbi:Gamma-tubulin complex component 4 [Geranomyces michiganensis]|nr:Gamma-tubulin complex component 4 [Geranomyces michiganensis]